MKTRGQRAILADIKMQLWKTRRVLLRDPQHPRLFRTRRLR
jgi:hypothetical protein